MKNLLVIIVSLALASCVSNDSKIDKSDELSVLIKDTIIHRADINPIYMVTKDLSGTDFGNYFNSLYKKGQFEQMVKFTAKSSIDQFGKEVIFDFYKKDLHFGYEIGKPHSQTINGEIITINYNANIIATKKVVRFNVVIENDSCKIVLPKDLKDFPS